MTQREKEFLDAMWKKAEEKEHDSVDLKYHTFSLSVGYKFKLGK